MNEADNTSKSELLRYSHGLRIDFIGTSYKSVRIFCVIYCESLIKYLDHHDKNATDSSMITSFSVKSLAILHKYFKHYAYMDIFREVVSENGELYKKEWQLEEPYLTLRFEQIKDVRVNDILSINPKNVNFISLE